MKYLLALVICLYAFNGNADTNTSLREIEHRNRIAAYKQKARKYTQTMIPVLRLTPMQAAVVFNIRINLSYQALYAFNQYSCYNKKLIRAVKPIQQQFECAMTALLSKQQKQWWDDYRRGLMLPEPEKTPLPAQEKPKTPSNNFFIIAEWAWD